MIYAERHPQYFLIRQRIDDTTVQPNVASVHYLVNDLASELRSVILKIRKCFSIHNVKICKEKIVDIEAGYVNVLNTGCHCNGFEYTKITTSAPPKSRTLRLFQYSPINVSFFSCRLHGSNQLSIIRVIAVVLYALFQSLVSRKC